MQDEELERLRITLDDMKREFPEIEQKFSKAMKYIDIRTGSLKTFKLKDERKNLPVYTPNDFDTYVIPIDLSLVELTLSQIAIVNSLLNEGGQLGNVYRPAPTNQIIDLFVKGHLNKDNLPTAHQSGYGGFMTGTEFFRFRFKGHDYVAVVHGSYTIDKMVEPASRIHRRNDADSIYDLARINDIDDELSGGFMIPLKFQGILDVMGGYIGGGSMLMMDYDEFLRTPDKTLYGEFGTRSGEHGRFGVGIPIERLKLRDKVGLNLDGRVEADLDDVVDDPLFVAVSGGLERARTYTDKLKSLGITKFEIGRPYTATHQHGGASLCIDLFGYLGQRSVGLHYPHNRKADIFLERVGYNHIIEE